MTRIKKIKSPKNKSKLSSNQIMKVLFDVVRECSDCKKENETISSLINLNEEEAVARRLYSVIQKIVRKECIEFFNSKIHDIDFYIQNSVKYHLKKNIECMSVSFKE